MSCMLLSYLFPLQFGFGKNQNDMLKQSFRYTFSITLSNTQHIYPRLIEVVVYCPKRPKKQGSTYIYERSGKGE